MIYSMTAFARRDVEKELGVFSWELRAVNHRYLEISFRLPEELRQLEGPLRERIAARLSRGKVDCNFRFKPAGTAGAELTLNSPMLQRLLGVMDSVADHVPDLARISALDILRWPGVLNAEESNKDAVQSTALTLFDEVLKEFVATREREGTKLADVISQRCTALEQRVGDVQRRLPDVIPLYRQRLLERLAQVKQELDSQRLEQEIVLFAQRIDVAEELDRLAVHIGEARRILAGGGAVGRRMDFLLQEFNREANTLASKSSDVEITRAAVDMKVLIEQMREQVQNLE